MPRTYVYVSNAADGDIGSYRMQADGALQPGARVKAGGRGRPPGREPGPALSLCRGALAAVFACTRMRSIATAVRCTPLSVAPLAASFPYISLDRTGRYLFGASYQSHLVSVNAVGADGRVAAAPLQVIPVGRNAHSIRIDESNRYVYVPTLGSDQMFQFAFDAKSGRLSSNTPAVVQMQPGTGPRHFVTSADNRFLYLLSELLATVTTFALDADTGLLTEIGSASGLPPDTQLVPGAPRLAPSANDRDAAAQPRPRHLGRGHPSHAGRQVPLHLRAHQQHAWRRSA